MTPMHTPCPTLVLTPDLANHLANFLNTDLTAPTMRTARSAASGFTHRWLLAAPLRACALIGALAGALALGGCAALTPVATPKPMSATPWGMPAAPAALNHGHDTAPISPPVAIAYAVPLTAPEPAPDLPPRAQPAGLEPPSMDIWERIRQGFAMSDLDTDLVRNREQWYASRPDYFLRMTERSRRYIHHIVEELEQRKMPLELALLPFIESAFNPEAVSSAKAAGMWQFMPATGKYFDLKQNAFRDERRDVLESTRAALDYLQKLHGMFGDWHLALAAYNWGEGSVGRAIARNKARGLPVGYTDLSMPNETRYYVPKLQAVKNIVNQPEQFNVQLPLIQNHPFFKSVAIERDMDVQMAARLAEVKVEDFKALNPQMSRPVIFASGTPQVLLPWDNAAVFERNVRANAHRPLATWTAWIAPKTMKVAEAAAQVGMSAEALRQANHIPNGMQLKAGSTLLVHRTGALNADVKESTADNAHLSLTPEWVLRRITVVARANDTVTSLAARHGVSAAELVQWNQLGQRTSLKSGQRLTVLVPSAPARKGGKALARKSASGKSKASAKPSATSAAKPKKKR